MGDGIEPFIKGLVGCAGAGLVGLIHGGLDSTEYGQSMPGIAHDLANYMPVMFSSAFVASSRYGLWKPSSRVVAAGVMVPLTIASEAAGYWVGRVIVAGVDKVVTK